MQITQPEIDLARRLGVIVKATDTKLTLFKKIEANLAMRNAHEESRRFQVYKKRFL